MSTAAEKFCSKFYSISTIIEFNPSWKNGTGYLDNAVNGIHQIVLLAGSEATFIDDDGRRAIAVGTEFGTIVMFERYKEGKGHDDGVIVHQMSELMSKLVDINSGAASEFDVTYILGGTELGNDQKHLPMNIGERLESQFRAYDKLYFGKVQSAAANIIFKTAKDLNEIFDKNTTEERLADISKKYPR